MPITVVFAPPLPSDSPEVFNSKAFSTLGDLNNWSTQANAVADQINKAQPNVDIVAGNIANINAAVADLPALSAKVSKTGDTMTGNLNVPSINGGQLAGMRNKLINGKMEIAQRGTSFPAVASGVYTLDRYRTAYLDTSAVATVTQQADAPVGNGLQNSLRVTVTTADAVIGSTERWQIGQIVEGYNVRDLVGRTFTLSFWVRSSKVGIHCLMLSSSNDDRSYIAEYSIGAANTWEFKTITVAGGLPSSGSWEFTVGRGLWVLWTLAAGSSFHTAPNVWQTSSFRSTSNQVNCMDAVDNIFAITGVQLETGEVATPFEHRSFGTELGLCERYCQFADGGFAGAVTSGAVYSGIIRLYPLMRTNPTAVVTNNLALNGFSGTPPLQILSNGAVRTSQTANVTTTDGYSVHRIRAEAEL